MFSPPAGRKEQQGSGPSAFFTRKSVVFAQNVLLPDLVVERCSWSLKLHAAVLAGTHSLLLVTKVGFYSKCQQHVYKNPPLGAAAKSTGCASARGSVLVCCQC